MTSLPLETSLPDTNFDTVIKHPEWTAKYLPQNIDTRPNLLSDICAIENMPDNTVTSFTPKKMFLPKWAKIVDDSVNYFLEYHCLEKDIETCINIIGTILKSRPKANIRLVDDNEYNREYISISLVSSSSNVSNMADYIYNCNLAIARSLPSNKLQYFVITME